MSKKTAPKKTPAKTEKSDKSKVTLATAVSSPNEDSEELDEDEMASHSSSSSASLGQAAAVAASNTEMSASFKNFRHHPDMENFYRFIYENDLRHEALAILDLIMVEKQARRAAKLSKAQTH